MKANFIVHTKWWHYGADQPIIETIPRMFESEEDAQKFIRKKTQKFLNKMNKARRPAPVYDSDGVLVAHEYPFKADFESEDDAAIVRFWDGDDYWPVYAFNIHPFVDNGGFSVYRGFIIHNIPDSKAVTVSKAFTAEISKRTIWSAITWVNEFCAFTAPTKRGVANAR